MCIVYISTMQDNIYYKNIYIYILNTEKIQIYCLLKIYTRIIFI